MSPDDLIEGFKELARADPEIRIDRARVGAMDELRIAGWQDVRTKRVFELLAADAVDLFGPTAGGDSLERWLRLVWDTVPELIEADRGPWRHLGYAVSRDEDGTEERVPFYVGTILRAASASAHAVQRLRDMPPESVAAQFEPEDDFRTGGSSLHLIQRSRRPAYGKPRELIARPSAFGKKRSTAWSVIRCPTSDDGGRTTCPSVNRRNAP